MVFNSFINISSQLC